MEKIKKIFLKIWAEQKRGKHTKKIVIVLAIFLFFVLIFVKTFFLSEEKIGTRRHRAESPFCQSDNECVLYDCTSCGNKFWVKQNVDNNSCDKQFPSIVGCKCELNQCKRVMNTNNK